MDRRGGGVRRRRAGAAVSYSRRRLAFLVLVSTGVVLLTALARVMVGGGPQLPPHLGQPVEGDVSLRDPYVAVEDGELHLFSTGAGLPVHRSDDGRRWVAGGSVFPEGLPAWARDVAPGAEDAWAPSLAHFDGRWHLYYSVSTFGTWSSAIGLATSPTLDPDDPEHGWTDRGIVVRSDHDETVTRVRAGEGAWNAIDPDVVVDGSGDPWLAWGSFAGGLYLRRIDASTGHLDEDEPVRHLAAREGPMDGIEASNLVRRDGYWYLFSSWDFCCRGVQSTYTVRVGRSEQLAGPYRDQQDRPLLEGGGSLVLGSHDDVVGPGHTAVLHQGDDWFLVHHFSDATAGGRATLSIRPLLWTDDGWPVAADPGFEPGGSDLRPAALAGTWEVSGYRSDGPGGAPVPVRVDLAEPGESGENGEPGEGVGSWALEDGTVTVTLPAGCAAGSDGPAGPDGPAGGEGDGERTYVLFVDGEATEMHGRTADGVPVRARRLDPSGEPAGCRAGGAG